MNESSGKALVIEGVSSGHALANRPVVQFKVDIDDRLLLALWSPTLSTAREADRLGQSTQSGRLGERKAGSG